VGRCQRRQTVAWASELVYVVDSVKDKFIYGELRSFQIKLSLLTPGEGLRASYGLDDDALAADVVRR